MKRRCLVIEGVACMDLKIRDDQFIEGSVARLVYVDDNWSTNVITDCVVALAHINQWATDDVFSNIDLVEFENLDSDCDLMVSFFIKEEMFGDTLHVFKYSLAFHEVFSIEQ